MTKVKPKNVLSPEDYKNYRNVRAAALMFLVLGLILALGGYAGASGAVPKKPDDPPPAFMIGLAVLGLFGVAGGSAIFMGSRRWAWLARVFAFPYLLAFPVGTILSYTVLSGLNRYLDSRDEIERARLAIV